MFMQPGWVWQDSTIKLEQYLCARIAADLRGNLAAVVAVVATPEQADRRGRASAAATAGRRRHRAAPDRGAMAGG
jgi:hypothetical protein